MTTSAVDAVGVEAQGGVEATERGPEVPRVTIGLPVYNGADYLEAALASLIDQDFTDFELLIADNGSTDDTASIIERFERRDHRVRVLPSSVNRGAAWNYNRLVGAARGEYFKWAAHDDVCEPSFVRRCVEILDQQPDVVLAYPETIDIDADGEFFKHWERFDHASTGDAVERFRDMLLRPRECFPVFGVIRTEALRDTHLIGRYNSSDKALLAELALRGSFVEIPEPLFLHRRHPGRSSTAYADNWVRAVWFDPALANRPTVPRWSLLGGYLAGVRSAPVAGGDRRRAARVVAAWMWQRRRALAYDLARATLATVQRLASRPVRQPGGGARDDVRSDRTNSGPSEGSGLG